MAKTIKIILIVTLLGIFASPARSGDSTTVYFPLVAHSTHTDRIHPIGDSITLGFDCNGGWRRMIYQTDFEFVGTITDIAGGHDGHGGWVSDTSIADNNISDYVVEWTEFANPDYVILMIGMNDYLAGILDAYYVANILDKISVPVILMGIPNVAPTPDPAITKYNADLAKLADFRGIEFVDIESILTPADMERDGIHPTCAGYEKMAIVIADAIARR